MATIRNNIKFSYELAHLIVADKTDANSSKRAPIELSLSRGFLRFEGWLGKSIRRGDQLKKFLTRVFGKGKPSAKDVAVPIGNQIF